MGGSSIVASHLGELCWSHQAAYEPDEDAGYPDS